nr:reverse transcriptase domain-containing protein [Tanacetum cinerariifolium]
MRTRNSYFLNNSSGTTPRRQNKRSTPNIVEPELRTIVEMADNRKIEELLQAPTEGYGEAIVLPKIKADHFEIKKFCYNWDVPNDVIKLMMFSYSLEGNAGVWYDKEPPNSILTWEDLVNKLVNQFFPPSKTTHLKNEIARFAQRFEETFGKAWERFKEMLRACPHHRFTELAQIDTFYNGLDDNDQDSLNAVAGGNILSKTTREALQITENKSKVRYSINKPNVSRMNTTYRDNASKSDDRIDKLADQISTLVDIFPKKIITPAPVKAVEESCVTCGGTHAYYNCLNTDSNQPSVCVATGTYNQVAPQNRASNYMAPPGFASNQSSTSGTLLSNTIPNSKGEMKAITIRSGVAYEGPLIPTPKKVVERETEETTDKEQLNFQGKLADRSITRPKGVAEDVFVKVGKFHFSTDFVVVDFEAEPCVPLILGRSILRTGRALIDFYGEEITLQVNDEAVTFNLNQTTRYSFTYDDLSVNRIDIIDIAREEYAQEFLSFFNNSSGGNPTSTFEHILSDSSPSLTLFEGSDFILEEIDAYLKDESVSLEIDHANCDPEGDICLIENLLNDDPFQLPSMDLNQGEVVKAKSSIEEPLELELKELPSHLEYAYLEGVDNLAVIISKDLKVDEKEALLKVFKSHKRAIAWKITDIKDVIAKLPYPTTVKGVRSFLRHAGFYRRFIQDFSKIARPMTRLLEKDTPFVFSNDCIDAFETLKKKLTKAPILVVSDWNLPFELMCDASDFAIGAVLGQRKTKHFQPIHYASKTMTEAQIHYTTTEKEID